jgi:hypothetical protein
VGFFNRIVGSRETGAQKDAQQPVARTFAPRSPFRLPSGALVGVVGESHYGDAIAATSRLAQRELPGDVEDDFLHDLARQEAGDVEWFTAYLVHELDNPYDANAIAVYSEAGKIGHLSRDNAAAYREVFDRFERLGADCALCPAFIRSGQGSIVLALSLSSYCLPEVNAERRRRAWEAWQAGEDFRAIASRLGFRDASRALAEARKYAKTAGVAVPERGTETGKSSGS